MSTAHYNDYVSFVRQGCVRDKSLIDSVKLVWLVSFKALTQQGSSLEPWGAVEEYVRQTAALDSQNTGGTPWGPV